MFAYFDNASTTYRKPKCVFKSVKLFKKYGANLKRGINQDCGLSIIQKTRENIKSLVKADDSYEVIFSQSATYSINQILHGFDYSKYKNIYICNFEHNSVFRVLKDIEKTENINIFKLEMDGYGFDITKIKNQFNLFNPDIIIINHVSNVCGLIQDYKSIFKISKQYGAINILDMAQSFGILKINMIEDKVDIAVFAGHKNLYGFSGVGGSVIKKSINLKSIIQGGTGYDSANEIMPTKLPDLMEPGTQNVIGIYSLFYSTQYLLKKGYEYILWKDQKNFTKLKNILAKSKALKIIDIKNSISIISCEVKNFKPDNYERFLKKFNIVTRIGLHCSPEAHKILNTFPDGTIRFSISLFTRNREFRQLKRCIKYIDNLIYKKE